MNLREGKEDLYYNSGAVVGWNKFRDTTDHFGEYTHAVWIRWWAPADTSDDLTTDIYRPGTGAHEYKQTLCVEQFYYKQFSSEVSND